MKRAWSISPLTLLLVAVTAQASPPGDKPETHKPAPLATTLAGETDENQWPLSLPDAIRIALDNTEIVRVFPAPLPPGTVTELDHRDPGAFLTYQPYVVVPLGFSDDPPRQATISGPIVIRPVKADTPTARSRAEVMALVRSVEQQYWVLAARRVRVWCTEQAIAAAMDVSRKEEAALLSGVHGTPVTDVADAAQRLEQFQEDLKTQTAKLADADRLLRRLLWQDKKESDHRHIVTVTRPIDQSITCDPSPAARSADTAYHQYQQAKQNRINAARRLEAQKAYYEQGRITSDRYFDFIGQHADAVAAEAHRVGVQYRDRRDRRGERNAPGRPVHPGDRSTPATAQELGREP